MAHPTAVRGLAFLIAVLGAHAMASGLAPVFLVSPSGSVTVDVSPPGLQGFGSYVVNFSPDQGASTVITYDAVAAQIVDNLSFTTGPTGAVTIQGAGFSYADIGIYSLSFHGSVPQIAVNIPASLTINIVPEPTPLVAASAAVVALSRRRVRYTA